MSGNPDTNTPTASESTYGFVACHDRRGSLTPAGNIPFCDRPALANNWRVHRSVPFRGKSKNNTRPTEHISLVYEEKSRRITTPSADTREFSTRSSVVSLPTRLSAWVSLAPCSAYPFPRGRLPPLSWDISLREVGPCAAAISLLPGRREHGLNLHRRFPLLLREADLGRCSLREVEVPPLGVRPAVRDLHADGLAALQVRDLRPGAERQGRVSRRQSVPVKPRATGRQPAVKARTVEIA